MGDKFTQPSTTLSAWRAPAAHPCPNGITPFVTCAQVQSRTPAPNTTSLDGLRSGDVGERIPRSQVQASSLFTNDFLP